MGREYNKKHRLETLVNQTEQNGNITSELRSSTGPDKLLYRTTVWAWNKHLILFAEKAVEIDQSIIVFVLGLLRRNSSPERVIPRRRLELWDQQDWRCSPFGEQRSFQVTFE